MNEARVEVARGIELPEVEPVLPVEVGVAAEHLLVHVLNLMIEAFGEAGCFPAPVVVVRCRFWGWDLRRRGELIVDEDFRILDLAVDPGLDVLDVHGSWEVDRVAFGVDPGVGGSRIRDSAILTYTAGCNLMTYGPAAMAGQL